MIPDPETLLNQTIQDAEQKFQGVSLWWIVLVIGVGVLAVYSMNRR